MQGELRFSHENYLKLGHPLFPTIRRRDKYPPVGKEVEIITAQGRYKATIAFKVKRKLGDIPTEFLRYDTARKGHIPENRGEAMDVLNSFYINPLRNDEEVIVIFCLVKEGQDEPSD